MQASNVEASIHFLPAVCSASVYVHASVQKMQNAPPLNILTLLDISVA